MNHKRDLSADENELWDSCHQRGSVRLLSFILLAVSIGTEYWYIIDVDEGKNSSLEYSSSHSGLWRIYEVSPTGENGRYHDISLYTDTSDHTEQEKQLLNLHRVIVVLLPLSWCCWCLGASSVWWRLWLRASLSSPASLHTSSSAVSVMNSCITRLQRAAEMK